MKRWCLCLAMLTGLTFCTACTSGSEAPAAAAQKLSGSFSVKLTLEAEDLTTEGTLTRYDAGNWSVYFESPASIAGVTLDFSGDEVAASYKGLSFSVPQAAMPAKAILNQCIQAMEEVAVNPEITGTQKDGLLQIAGELAEEPYTLSFDADGNPVYFQWKNMGACITFQEFQADIVVTTVTTTIASLVVTTATATETVHNS